MRFDRSSAGLAGCVALALTTGPAASAVPENPPAEKVTVTAAPIGRFGFGVGTGGMLWHAAIGHLIVLQVQAGGPAEKAGMHVGDEILAVDGLTVPGRARSEVFGAMRNKDAGKPVTFKVASDEGKSPAHEMRIVPVDPYKERR